MKSFLNIADFDKDAALALRDDDVNMLFTPSPYNFWTPEIPLTLSEKEAEKEKAMAKVQRIGEKVGKAQERRNKESGMTSEERDQLVEEKKREMSRERDERRARTASEDLDPLGIKVKHAQEENHAAKQIQATFRGNRDRKDVKARKESKERKRGMSVIGGSAVVDRRKQSKESVDVVVPGSLELRIPEDKAALRIQAIQRGKKDRARVQQMQAEKGAAIKIQAIQRGKKDRRRVADKRQEMML